MYITIIVSIISLAVVVGSFLYFKNHYDSSKDEIYNSLKKEQEDKIKDELIKSHQTLQDIRERVERRKGELKSLQNEVSLLNRQIQEKTSFNNNLNTNIDKLKNTREKELETFIADKREVELNSLQKEIVKQKEIELLRLQKEIEEWAKSAQDIATDNYNTQQRLYEGKLLDIVSQIQQAQEELNTIELEVKDFQQKRHIINEEINRGRRTKEQQDFYSINISNEDKEDIEIINSILPKLNKIENINKLIYDNYINRNLKDMIKRVLINKEISGIYKITNKETQEIYIGKSTNIKKRWSDHVKSAYGLEGVADSQFQRALKEYGIDSFTWELLEEVSKDKLTEREKYWIEFYDTKTYGYNQRKG